MNKIKQLSENTADLYLYGDIYDSWWDDESNSASNLKDKLEELGNVSEINLHINSLGGDVVEGIAMFNLLKQHPAKINVYIDGFACSIASVVAMAGDTVYMPKNTYMMIHNCWTWAQGNSKDLRKTAEDLDKIMEGSIESYLAKINISREELIELLNAETYLTAQECYDYGFADVLLPISNKAIEESATASIMQLVQQNKEYKKQIDQLSSNKQELKIKEVELDIDKIADKISERLSKKIKENSINKKAESKTNSFNSFFNAIFKEEK